MITSGLLSALQGKGIEDIAEIRFSGRKALVKDFFIGWGIRCSSLDEILIPQIEYLTNDSWEDISSYNGASGWPILHQAQYSKGYLYVLTIPDNFSDLYKLPLEVLGRIRTVASADLKLRLDGPSQVSLFVYDNGTCIVESFLPEAVTVKLVADDPVQSVTDILSGEQIQRQEGTPVFVWGRARVTNKNFEITIPPHSFRVFRVNR